MKNTHAKLNLSLLVKIYYPTKLKYYQNYRAVHVHTILKLLDFPKIHIFGSDSKNNYVVLDMYNGDLEYYRWRKGGTLT